MLSTLPEDIIVTEFLDKLEVPELLHILATNKEWKDKYTDKFSDKIKNYRYEQKLYSPVFVDSPELDSKDHFEGKNEIKIPYKKYKRVVKRYKHSGGPTPVTLDQLNSDIKKVIDDHKGLITGNDLFEILQNYLSHGNLEFWFGEWGTTEPFDISHLKSLFFLDKKATLIFMRGWYYHVLKNKNFVILKMLEYIFTKYGNDHYHIDHYEIDEVDDSSYMRVTILNQK